MIYSGFSGTDLKHEIRHLSQSMHQEFRVKNQPCIYEPATFRQFCISSGALTIFDNVLSSVTGTRGSKKRSEQNKKITVNIIYGLYFALSQLNNFLQIDQSMLFMLKNLNKEALDTERNLGKACSSRKVYYMPKILNSLTRNI